MRPRRCKLVTCKKWFVPKNERQRYCKYQHKNRANQWRIRQRAKNGTRTAAVK